jgi:polysaccharide deacetylase family protein (PEP-CTERM system associated)
MVNALTVDVEEYFQAHAFERAIPPDTWERMPARVVANTRRVLGLLREAGAHATFFVLGWVADHHPALVREIVDGGHELASHGYAHQLLYRQTRPDFEADLERSLGAIARAAGGTSHVAGYRAPAFSLTEDSRWALDAVRAHGLRYDSSILPVAVRDGGSALRGGKRYGLRGASRFAARVLDGLWEFPVSTVRFAGRVWPVAGGGYLRLYPLWLTRRAIRRINDEGQPAVVYLHPWELDAEEPPVPNTPALARARHRINVSRTEGRLRTLLGEGRWGPMCEVFAAQLAS